MENVQKPVWETPEVQKYGTFESATQGCDKLLGGSDGFTFMGQVVVCAS